MKGSNIIAANQRVPLRVRVNGEDRVLQVEPPRILAQVLRDDLGLTGTKVACGMANCGACTVLRDGTPIYSCITLALDCDGSEITTIEGLAHKWARQNGERETMAKGELHPLQNAFIAQDAYQCGFCTSGQIMTLAAFLVSHTAPTEDEIRDAVEGNLCRCGAYLKIVKAGLSAAELMRRVSSLRGREAASR